MTKIFWGCGRFQNLAAFLDGDFGFVEGGEEDEFGNKKDVAYLHKDVWASSGFALGALTPDTIVEIEAFWSRKHGRFCAVRVIALHQPEPESEPVTIPWRLSQFTKKLVAFKKRTREELYFIRCTDGYPSYYVVAERGTDIVLRVVHAKDLAEAKLAIGVREHPPLTKGVSDSTPVTMAQEPKTEMVAVKSVVSTKIVAPPAKKASRTVLKGFDGLARMLREKGVSNTAN